jgi:hypothetical protein
MSAAIRLDLLPSAAKGRPSGGSFPAAETCAEIPRRAHGGQRRMRLSMGDRHLHGAPWPRTSDMHHMVGSRAVQQGPADLKSVRQENDGARMGARDLRASQGIVVSRYYPNLHRGIRAPVIACERADERSRERRVKHEDDRVCATLERFVSLVSYKILLHAFLCKSHRDYEMQGISATPLESRSEMQGLTTTCWGSMIPTSLISPRL